MAAARDQLLDDLARHAVNCRHAESQAAALRAQLQDARATERRLRLELQGAEAAVRDAEGQRDEVRAALEDTASELDRCQARLAERDLERASLGLSLERVDGERCAFTLRNHTRLDVSLAGWVVRPREPTEATSDADGASEESFQFADEVMLAAKGSITVHWQFDDGADPFNILAGRHEVAPALVWHRGPQGRDQGELVLVDPNGEEIHSQRPPSREAPPEPPSDALVLRPTKRRRTGAGGVDGCAVC